MTTSLKPIALAIALVAGAPSAWPAPAEAQDVAIGIRVQLVKATAAAISDATDAADAADAADTAGATSEELPAALVGRLRQLLGYETYSLLARAEIEAAEETEAVYDVGTEYQVSFRLRRLAADPADGERFSLEGFRVLRLRPEGDWKRLVHTNLTLPADKPMVLGLSKTETSDRALMVVLEHLGATAPTAQEGIAGVAELNR